MADKEEIRESDNSRVPAQIVTLSINSMNITTALMADAQVEIQKNTTLNEALDLETENSLGFKRGRDFKMDYFGVGVGGSQATGTHPRLPVTQLRVNQHSPSHQSMFAMIPILARPLGDDLPANDPVRQKLRMRIVERLENGEPWVFYYLCEINKELFAPKTKIAYREPTTGNEIPTDYVYKNEDLRNPQPAKLLEDGSVPLSDRMLTSTGLLDFSLNATLLEEMKNACRVKYGDASLAAINEYAPFYTIDTTTEGEVAGGGRQRYAEVLSATPIYLVTETHARDANANGTLTIHFDIGTSSPLLLGQ